MTDNLILILITLAGIAIGVFIGNYLQRQKSNSIKQILEDREMQLLDQIEAQRNELSQEKLTKEELRKIKDDYAIRLSKKEVDFDNLLQRNSEQKEEVEKLQEIGRASCRERE